MNDLFSGSFSRFRNPDLSPPHPSHCTVSPPHRPDGIEVDISCDANYGIFWTNVESIKDELKDLENLCTQLQVVHGQSKNLHSAKAVKEIRTKMDNDVTQSLKKAKFIKVRLEAMDRSIAANRSVPGCGPGSYSDRVRISVVNGLREKLSEQNNLFNEFRSNMTSEYRETVHRLYYTVTGENPAESVLDSLIATGQSENFLQKAIQEEQGRGGQAMDTIMEIQERHDSVKEIEKNLKDLHQVFLDMADLVESQDEQINDIETHVQRASSFVTAGADQLQVAAKHKKNIKKWTCFSIILLLLIIAIIAIIVLSLHPWTKKTIFLNIFQITF